MVVRLTLVERRKIPLEPLPKVLVSELKHVNRIPGAGVVRSGGSQVVHRPALPDEVERFGIHLAELVEVRSETQRQHPHVGPVDELSAQPRFAVIHDVLGLAIDSVARRTNGDPSRVVVMKIHDRGRVPQQHELERRVAALEGAGQLVVGNGVPQRLPLRRERHRRRFPNVGPYDQVVGLDPNPFHRRRLGLIAARTKHEQRRESHQPLHGANHTTPDSIAVGERRGGRVCPERAVVGRSGQTRAAAARAYQGYTTQDCALDADALSEREIWRHTVQLPRADRSTQCSVSAILLWCTDETGGGTACAFGGCRVRRNEPRLVYRYRRPVGPDAFLRSRYARSSRCGLR